MRSTIFALACGAALISAPAVFADPPAQPATTTPVSATTGDPDNPVTCRVLYHEGAVNANAKECHTKHQWDAMQRAMQHDISMDQQRSLQGGMP
jgi:hypothetical protein